MSYKLFDGTSINFTDVAQSYTVGTGANAAVDGSWPTIGVGVPFPTKKVSFYATQDVLIRFTNLEAYLQQAGGILPAGNFVQQTFLANTWHEIELECISISVVRSAINGTLYFNALA